MFQRIFFSSMLVIAGVGLGGCAAKTVDEAGERSDSVALQADESEAGSVEIATESSRACTTREWSTAQQHATLNHTELPPPTATWGPNEPTVTSCQVRNGWIVYTYSYD